MAEHGKAEYATSVGNDYAEHLSTYRSVMCLTKVGTVSALAVVVALAIYGTVGSVFWTSLGVLGAIVFMAWGLAKDSVGPAVGWLVLLLIVWALMV
jgi:hypothetical protein